MTCWKRLLITSRLRPSCRVEACLQVHVSSHISWLHLGSSSLLLGSVLQSYNYANVKLGKVSCKYCKGSYATQTLVASSLKSEFRSWHGSGCLSFLLHRVLLFIYFKMGRISATHGTAQVVGFRTPKGGLPVPQVLSIVTRIHIVFFCRARFTAAATSDVSPGSS